jgi:hypothetical protein
MTSELLRCVEYRKLRSSDCTPSEYVMIQLTVHPSEDGHCFKHPTSAHKLSHNILIFVIFVDRLEIMSILCDSLCALVEVMMLETVLFLVNNIQ